MKLTWFGHSSFKLETALETIYVDPVRTNKLLGTVLEDERSADIVLVSHSHWDHFDPRAVFQVSKETTRLIGPEEIVDKFSKELTFYVSTNIELKNYLGKMEIVRPGTEKTMKNGNIKVLKASEGVCFLVETDYRVLFMGDSTLSVEMMRTRPDLIVIPYWALKQTEEQTKIKMLPKKTKIIVCHYHSNEMGLSNFFVAEEDLEKTISTNLNVIRLNKAQTLSLDKLLF